MMVAVAALLGNQSFSCMGLPSTVSQPSGSAILPSKLHDEAKKGTSEAKEESVSEAGLQDPVSSCNY